MKIKGNYIAYGLISSLIISVFIILCDAIDEFIIDSDSFLGFIFSIATPIIISIVHIVYYLKKRPNLQEMKQWFLSFLPLTALIGFIILELAINDAFFIPQIRDRCLYLCFNGIEYGFYFIFTVCGYIIIVGLFHIIYFFVNRSKKQKEI